jgi:hypothetical protein
MTDAEQLVGLFKLQQMAGAYEVNTVLNRRPGDVASVAAAFTPNASEICFASGQGYDVWRDGNLKQTNLDIGAAADILIMEYMKEKVRRAKRNDKGLRAYTDEELLTHLLKGYQSGKTEVAS